jgi:hypothetical protein
MIREPLDDHLAQRGELAHRAATTTITKRQVSDFYQLTRDLTESMDRRLGAFLFEAVRCDPFAVRNGRSPRASPITLGH